MSAPRKLLPHDPLGNERHMVLLRRDNDGNPTVWCDPGIEDLVDSLNNKNVQTVASCSGHMDGPGGIILADGRCLVVLENLQQFNKVYALIKGAL